MHADANRTIAAKSSRHLHSWLSSSVSLHALPQVLARDVVYEMVPQDVRRDWHAAAAAAMEAYSSGAGEG